MASCCTPREEPPVAWWRLGLAALISSNAMIVTLAINISELPYEHWLFLNICLIGAALFTLELVGRPLFRAALRRTHRASLSFEALFLLAMAGAAGVSLLSLFQGSGPVYFEVVAILALIYALGDRAARSSRGRALEAIQTQLAARESFSVLREGHSLQCTPRELRRGDRLHLPAQARLPAAATVLAGRAWVRDDHHTGEYFLRSAGPGDSLVAGTLVLDSPLHLQLSDAAPAPALPPTALELRDHHWSEVTTPILRWFLPVVVLVALGTTVIWTLLAGFSTAILYGLAVLLIACPCAMGFAIPLAAWTVRERLSRLGISLQRPRALHELAQVTTVVFDKTGTLTHPEPTSLEVLPHPDAPTPCFERETLMGMAVALEAASHHPLARALLSSSYTPLECQVRNVQNLPGRGIAGELLLPGGACHEVQILGVSRRDSPHHLLELRIDGAPQLHLRLREDWRPGVEPTLQRLRDEGLQLLIASGDRRERTRPFRHLVDEIASRQDPGDKAAVIRALKAQGQKVLFVGDGLNDLPALQAADISIVCHTDDPVLLDEGDLYWDGADLGALAEARRVALHATSTLRLNLTYATAYNVVGMSLAALGLLHPVSAALIMVGSSTFITWFTSLRMASLDGEGHYGEEDRINTQERRTQGATSPRWPLPKTAYQVERAP